MSRFVEDMRHAVRDGRLPVRFRADDVRRACPGWADHTYGVFVTKHRQGNPGGYTAYFQQHVDGSYSLLWTNPPIGQRKAGKAVWGASHGSARVGITSDTPGSARDGGSGARSESCARRALSHSAAEAMAENIRGNADNQRHAGLHLVGVRILEVAASA